MRVSSGGEVVTAPVAGGRIDPMVWRIAGVAMLAPLMSTLASTVVNVSLATLGRDLHVSLTTIQWVSSGYLLALALTLPLSGWLVDRVGAKHVYIGCFTVFTLTSLLCGTAGSATTLILFRALQGCAGGVLTPMAQLMIAREAGPNVAHVMGISVMPAIAGPIFGPALAGFVLQHAGWPWIFYLNLPIGVLATLLAWRVLPADEQSANRRDFDWLGFMLLSPALVLLLHSLEGLGGKSENPLGRYELLPALLLLGGFFVHGLGRGDAALVDVRLFRQHAFAAAAVTQLVAQGLMYGGMMLFPLYLLLVKGTTPASVGVLLAAMGLGLMTALPWMGALTDRFGPRRVSMGGAIVALAGTLPFALLGTPALTTPVVCAALFVRGVGMGSINIPSITVAYAAIAKEAMPIATTALNSMSRLGGPIATTLLALFLHARLSDASAAPQAFTATFRLFCVFHALAIAPAACLPWRESRR
jgi:EmrB/QacA subfamily drug resistance transporter